MDEEVKKEIARFQDNLQTIRKVAGWTATDLGNQIGVSKQTISNLENHNNPMTKTQYIAIRAVLDLEIATNAEKGPIIRSVMQALLNEDDEAESEVDEVYDLTETVSDEKVAAVIDAPIDVSKKTVNPKAQPKPASPSKKSSGAAAMAAGVGVVAVGAVVVPWLLRMTKGKH